MKLDQITDIVKQRLNIGGPYSFNIMHSSNKDELYLTVGFHGDSQPMYIRAVMNGSQWRRYNIQAIIDQICLLTENALKSLEAAIPNDLTRKFFRSLVSLTRHVGDHPLRGCLRF